MLFSPDADERPPIAIAFVPDATASEASAVEATPLASAPVPIAVEQNLSSESHAELAVAPFSPVLLASVAKIEVSVAAETAGAEPVTTAAASKTAVPGPISRRLPSASRNQLEETPRSRLRSTERVQVATTKITSFKNDPALSSAHRRSGISPVRYPSPRRAAVLLRSRPSVEPGTTTTGARTHDSPTG